MARLTCNHKNHIALVIRHHECLPVQLLARAVAYKLSLVSSINELNKK